MMPAAAVRWARRRSEVEWVALAAGVATFGYLGWDDALWNPRAQLLLHLLAIGAIAGLVIIGLRGGRLPRTRIDLALLGLLTALALATASAMNVGMSLRAMAAIVATAAMLPVALVAIRHRPSWVGMLTAVPVLLLSIPTLVALASRRLEWILVGAPGLPPIRLLSEGTPFGSVAVPPFVIWPAWALAGLIESPGWRRAVRTGLVLVGVPLTILSGSRSAWLAIGAVLVLAAVPWAWSHRDRIRLRRRPDAATFGLGIVGILGLAAIAALVAPRVMAVSSLLYRTSLWRDTLDAWGTDPLLGIGPGFMPYARQAAAADFSFPVRQPHSHNLPLGILGDAGILGVLVALVLVATIVLVAGPWRSRTPVGQAAAYVLLGLGIGGLFEDLTFLPNFNLLAILLLAVALSDAGAVSWVRPAGGRMRVPALVAGGATAAVLLGAMVVADAGAIAYRSGTDAAAGQRWGAATERMARAVEIDPWHPAGPKALAVAADAAENPELARAAAEAAVSRNPGDAPSWINLALVCGGLGDRECQGRATDRAVATAAFLEAELLNAALSYEALGRTDDADDAYRRSLLSQRLTAFASDWPREVTIADAGLGDDFGALAELNRVLAWWAVGEPIDATSIGDPATRALAHAIRGERDQAEAWLSRAIAAAPADVVTWDVAVILREHWGLPVDRELAVAGVVRGRPFPGRDPGGRPRLTFDIASFRAYPGDGLVEAAARLQSDPAFPWVLERTLR